MHIKYKVLFITVMFVSLFGCDISPEGDGGNGVTSSTINAFNVVDDADGDQQLVMPIHDNNAESSALFQFTWDVVSSDPFWLEIYISSNTSLDETTDTLVYQIQCGGGTEFNCDHIDATSCGLHYDPEFELDPDTNERLTNPDGSFIILDDHYYIRCNQSADHWLTEITDRLELVGFPATHDFILKVCTDDEENCPDTFVDVVIDRI